MRKRGRRRIEGPCLEWCRARLRGAACSPAVEVSWRHVCLIARIRELLASLVAKRPFVYLKRHMAGAMCCIGLFYMCFFFVRGMFRPRSFLTSDSSFRFCFVLFFFVCLATDKVSY